MEYISNTKKKKTKEIAEYGDFQTPFELAHDIASFLSASGMQPASLLEPTCGIGNFLFACHDLFPCAKKIIGADINDNYIKQAEARRNSNRKVNNVKLVVADFFTTDWEQVINNLPDPILIIGNLPWVTNAHLGVLKSQNLPVKSNFQNRNGLEAITGRSNFDISEWMLIQLLNSMKGRRGTLAMLCKSSVVRRVLCHAWQNNISIEKSDCYSIDADKYFNAAVDAVLLVIHFGNAKPIHNAHWYSSLHEPVASKEIGYQDNILISDIKAYKAWKHLCGTERIKWRSGIKHDCAKIMELKKNSAIYINGLGETVELDDVYLYPMLKSSDVANGNSRNAERWMIVTQKRIGEDTIGIQRKSPKTWQYLQRHVNFINQRGSSVYKNRPPFSIFGVGDYSFTPWKIAISGFYKKIAFKLIGPVHKKPVVLDDTSYFIPCHNYEQAELLFYLLNSTEAHAFYQSFIFWDAKRPITIDLLRRLDIKKLAEELGLIDAYQRLFCEYTETEQSQYRLFGSL